MPYSPTPVPDSLAALDSLCLRMARHSPGGRVYVQPVIGQPGRNWQAQLAGTGLVGYGLTIAEAVAAMADAWDSEA